MKKSVFAFIIVCFILFLLLPISSALLNCKDDFMRGDTNGDWIIDITDPIYTLQYLFSGGLAPNCLQQGDANGDNVVDISDVLYTLKYLFQGGPAPVTFVNGAEKVEIYGKGSDDPPELEFLGIADEITKVTELPAVFEVIELTNENGREISEGIMSGGDIVNCKVDVYEKDQSGNYVYVGTTFDAYWQEGIGITSEPLQFLVGDDDGIIVESEKHSYTLDVSCKDAVGQVGTTSLSIETIKEETPSEPNCRRDIDVCCYSDGNHIIHEKLNPGDFSSPTFDEEHIQDPMKGTHYACRRDCDAKVVMQPDGSMKTVCDGPAEPACSQIGPRDVIAGFDTRAPQQVPRTWDSAGSVDFCNNLGSDHVHPPLETTTYNPMCSTSSLLQLTKADKNERKIQLLADEPTPQKSPCYVDSMTIMRDLIYYDQIKEDFELPKSFLSEREQGKLRIGTYPLPLSPDENNNYNVPLGPVEGWMTYKGGSYFAGYGFVVDAVLEEGSKHENCPHGQFRKGSFFGVSIDESGTWVERESVDKMGSKDSKELGIYMQEFDKIKKTSIQDLPRLKTAEEVSREISTKKYIVSLFDGKEWTPFPKIPLIDAIRSTHCHHGGNLFCSDDFGKYQKQPSDDGDMVKYVPLRIAYQSSAPPAPPLCYTKPPKIMWWDMPGPYIGQSSFSSNNIITGKLPWPGYSRLIQSFVMIAEDSGPRTADTKDSNGNIIYAKGFQYRWFCTLNNLETKRNDNVDLKSGDPAKMRRVTTTKPSCECIKQKRVPGGLYEDDITNGGKISC